MTERKYDFVEYESCPSATIAQSMEGYIEHGWEVGGFLYAVLTNDLFEAVGRADHVNRLLLPAIVSWIYNEAPSACWGDKDRVKTWMEEHRDA